MEIDSEKYEQIPSFNEKQKHLEVALRATSVLFILAAFLLMVTDKQTFTFVDVTFSAKFYYSSAFCYYVGATGLLMVYSMVSLIFACRSAPGDAYSFFLLDLLALELMTSAWSATMAVAYIGKIGQNKLTWSKVCDNAESFCNRSGASIALSFFPILIFFTLTLKSHIGAKRERN